MVDGIKFDPGFGPYVLAFQGTLDYLYRDINRFRNFSQKKLKFRQYYKKMLELFYNNVGFYTGCLLWAGYIKSQPDQPILNNPCLGQTYNEDADLLEPNFMLNFLNLFPKDMKYFINEQFEFEDKIKPILEMYKEFIIINEGFVNTKMSSDLKLPQEMNTEDIDQFKAKVDKAIASKNLASLSDSKNLLLKNGVTV